MAKVKPIPDGYHSVTPYMYLSDAAGAIEFYKKAFGAQELMRMPGPNGKIGHAEIRIGDSVIMLSDENPQMGVRSAKTLGGINAGVLLYVEDSDAVTKRAIDAGAKMVRPPENAFYGDRTATVEDPFGNQWFIHTHIEDVPPEEMEKRMAAMAPA